MKLRKDLKVNLLKGKIPTAIPIKLGSNNSFFDFCSTLKFWKTKNCRLFFYVLLLK